MASPEHSLENPSFITAGVLFGLWGGGVVVTQVVPPLFWLGIVVCFGSAIFTIWRYAEAIVASIEGKSGSAVPRWEAITVATLVMIEIIGSIYIAAPVANAEISEMVSLFGGKQGPAPSSHKMLIPIPPLRRRPDNQPRQGAAYVGCRSL